MVSLYAYWLFVYISNINKINGFKMLGSFVGTDSYVLNALQAKDEVASTLLRYPNAQARYHFHKFCFNEKINYWMRTQFPEHTIGFIDHFKSIQLKLIASYHGVYDQRDLDFRREKLLQVYKRAALPIDVGGMSLRNIDNVNLVAYPCSFVASIKETAKVFPHWISLNECGDVSTINSLRSQRTHDRLTSFVEDLMISNQDIIQF